MSRPIDFVLIQQQKALANWIADCRHRVNLKFPKIDFDSDHWPINTLHKTDQPDWYFTDPFADFESRDKSFRDALRGLMAEMIIKGKPKALVSPIQGFRLLKNSDAHSVFDITLNDLRKIEDDCLSQARLNPLSAARFAALLSMLQKYVELLADKGVISQIGFRVSSQVKSELWKLVQFSRSKMKVERSESLDHKIEAFNDALNALYENDPRLSAGDRVAITSITRLMCAPSRINEVLCSSIDDHVTVEDYSQRLEDKDTDGMHRVHQMLLITMKGSKGAQWSAKPALNFMIDAFHYTTEVIKQHGQRSRMLVEWYQQHPNTLYLPPELEYLRGKDISRENMAKIIYLTENITEFAKSGTALEYFNTLKHFQFKGQSPTVFRKDGVKCKVMINLLHWRDIEQFLLQKVRDAMDCCRKVTLLNHYKGDLSKMLFLFDSEYSPYLPSAANHQFLAGRLKGMKERRSCSRVPSLFEKLGITMPVKDKVQIAKIESHDPRRWLTTMALRHGENLSDVLINKWANRLSLAQLKAYDMRSNEELAESSKMPESVELVDISKGIEQARKLEEVYGAKSAIVTAQDAGISVTSMEKVLNAVEDRPIARTSEQIIIIYPSRYGVCFHQHHETPCRNYNSCGPCDENAVVKGHLPTNDNIRRRAGLVHESVIRQLEKLVPALNRGIADDHQMFAEHILVLVKNGLSPEQMADSLIDQFHEIKHLIADKLLVNRLEEAFVMKGYVKQLDNSEVASGALIKYHNPTYHASPGLEKALDSHGGREQIERDEQKLIDKYPQFAPKALGLKDERNLLVADDDENED